MVTFLSLKGFGLYLKTLSLKFSRLFYCSLSAIGVFLLYSKESHLFHLYLPSYSFFK